MHKKQISNLLDKSPKERYEFFVRYCADFRKVWGLAVNDNWVIFKDADNDEIFPLWPHEDLAEACCFSEHRELGAIPKAIELDAFVDHCVPDMLSNKVFFGIFYDKKRMGLMIDGETLKKEINSELEAVWK